jgi:cytochrome c
MKLTLATTVVAGLLAAPALAGGHASGDAAAGEKAFNQCKSCHMIEDADGNSIVKGGKTGPNLFGLPGRTAGTQADFSRYKDSLVAAGEAGLVWDEAQFSEYVADPTKFLRAYLDDSKARSGMTFKLRKEEDALNIWAYIASVSPEPES